MKRFGDLYKDVCDPVNIQVAFQNAARGKANYREVKKIRENTNKYLSRIEKSLREKTFTNSPYIEFERVECGKKRHIHKLPFYPDRIVQHALCQVLTPIWDKQYIRDTYSCIVGRGIHDGVKRVKKALRNHPDKTTYCMKFDIRKYYPNVDNEILKSILRRKIKCKDTLWLLDEIIDSTTGIPIGNYTSQHFANLYLSGFDHWAKEHLRLKHYFRYCDDIVILGDSKKELKDSFNRIEQYLRDNLKLSIKPNWQIFPVEARGIDFLGYRFFHNYTLLRKGIVDRYKKRLKQIKAHENPHKSNSIRSTIASYEGWMKYANCYNLQKSLKI